MNQQSDEKERKKNIRYTGRHGDTHIGMHRNPIKDKTRSHSIYAKDPYR